MVLPFFLLLTELRFWDCGSGKGEEPSGGRVLRLIQIRLTASSLSKIPTVCQVNSPQPRIADSSSTKAVSFSSACTTKRFSLSRCASAIQIVRPLESIVATQPQLQPALPLRTGYTVPHALGRGSMDSTSLRTAPKRRVQSIRGSRWKNSRGGADMRTAKPQQLLVTSHS
jgi:hypothetical protein